MSEENRHGISERVLEAIRSGRVSMKPRWYFVVYAILGVAAGVVVLLLLLYTASFIVFVLRVTGIWFVPSFGGRGWFALARSAPWLLIVLCFLYVGILEALIRRYAFAWRRPLLYSAVGIIAVGVIGGILIGHTSFHRGLFRDAQRNRLPFAGGLYRGFGLARMPDVHVGSIRGVAPGEFTMQERHGETVRVIIAPETHLPIGDGFMVGDTVVVFGPRQGDLVRAVGIRKVDAEFGPDAPESGRR